VRRAAPLVLALAACSTPTSKPAYDDPPSAKLALSFSTDPPAFPDGVAIDATILIQLDDFPDPDTVSFGPVLLRSGKVNLDADLKVDLLHQQIRLHGRSLLQRGTTYEVVVASTVASFSERTPAATTTWSFTTGTQKANPPPPPTVKFADVAAWLSARPLPATGCPAPMQPSLGSCAPYCHTPCDDLGRPRTPLRRLDLSADPSDPVYGLLDVPSVGLEGTAAQIPRVLPGDSAHSLLMRKLLGGGQKPSAADTPYPMLRADGRRMPLGNCTVDDAGACLTATTPDDDFRHPLPTDVLERIQQWIDGGALR